MSFNDKVYFFLQPLLIILWPAFFLYSRSVGEAYLKDFSLLLIFIIIFFFVAFFVLKFIFKSYLKVSIFLSIFLSGCFLFPMVYDNLENFIFYGIRIFRLRNLLFIGFLFLIYIFFKILKLNIINRNFGKFLILPFLILIFLNIGNAFLSYNSIKSKIKTYKEFNNKFLNKNVQNLLFPKKLGYYPDIYFIILDCYPSDLALNNYFNYDNNDFTNKLKKLGFYIAGNSLSNYPVTVKSIPNTMNMNYCPFLFSNDHSHALAHYMLNKNNIMKYLKTVGYKFYNIPSFWNPLFKLYESDYEENYTVPNYFISKFLSMTVFGLFLRYFFDKFKYNLILNQFNSLSNMYKILGRKFVFVHIHSPHSPFVFDHDGSFVSLKWPNDTKAYLNQLNFISSKVYSVITKILNNSEKKPIIILQSDHGAPNYMYESDLSEHEILMARFGILSAFYLPVLDKSKFLKDITPINNFRFIFNNYFGTNFEILKNKQFG